MAENLTLCEEEIVACVAGVRKGRGRELGREIAREGGGRRERLQGSHCFRHPAY